LQDKDNNDPVKSVFC